MTPERWQHIDSVFHAALERPPEERARFLKEACAGDEAARSEIEALIMAHEQSGEFLDRPAYEGPNKTLSAQPLKQTPGTILGHYKILGALGEGGMGQVYLALDTRLGRKIALKLLPPEFTSDGGRVRRFEQEARAASALSHPNVCVIHEIGGTADGLQFIAMEYIEGMTLRQRIAQKRLKLSESLDIAIQTATGLAVAHAAGIIHRDIKPENVMLRSDGLVKILDFGLAKLTERQTIETETEPLMRSLAQTGPGMIMGTVAYMSPEQARGLPVDARTDIWTLGVVLYEMVVGQQPFSGPTPSDLLVSILEQEPPRVTHKLGEAPAELERILRKALKKDPEERYQVVKDMALDLKSLSQELKHEAALEHAATPAPTAEAQIAAGAAQAAVATHEKLSARTDEVSAARWASSAEYFVSEIKRHKVTTWLILATIVIAAAGIVFWYKLSNHNQAVAPLSAKLFQHTSMRKLTTNGNALVAAISPNGKYVAYVTFERPSSPQATGKSSLWIRQVTTTGNIQIVRPAEVWYQSVTFSPDGDYVFYVVTDTQNATALYKVPALGQGGSPIKIMGGVTSGVSLSPNGKQITFVRHDPAHKEARLMVADADGTNEQILATRKSPESFGRGPFTARPAWSPDGKVIACSVWVPDSQGLYANVLAVNVSDRVEKVLLPHRWSEVTDVSWLSDGSGLLMNAKEQEASFWQLWLLSYPGGEARRITGDLSDYDRSVNLTADSTALISMQEQTLSNIWISPNGHGGRATQITSGAGRYFDLSWTADGQILYASDASGSAEIWEMESDGTGAKQLTAGTGRNYGPIASPDGRYIIFHSTRLGRTFHIWRMDADGNNPKQLTSGNTESTFAQISPDGQWVVYTQIVSTGAQNVWKVSIDGGTPVQLTDKDSLRPSISPDGKMIACWQSDNQPSPTWHIALIPFAGGPPLKLLEIPPGEAASWGQPLLWSPDGSAVTYVDQLNAVNNVWSQPIDGRKPTQLTDFKSDQIFSFNWSRDGKLVLSRGVSTSDVIMISDSP